MGKENMTRTLKPETHEPDTCPMIVGEVKKSIPRMRTVKPKEKIKVTSMKINSTTDKGTTTCVTSGNIMKLCINLMPVLALAKEPEEEVKKEVNSCPTVKEPENSRKQDSSVTKLVCQQIRDTRDSCTGFTLKKETEIKQKLPSGFVLPPLIPPKPAPECCDHEETKMCFTPLPPISLFEQTIICPNSAIKGCRDDGDNRPWIDNPLLSGSRSAEFHLPDISLSSLEALLQTVTQKLTRKRRGCDEGPWRRVESNHLLMAVNERRLREKMVEEQIDFCTKKENRDNIAAVTETSVREHSVRSQSSLPPLFSTPKPTLILTMMKKTS